MTKANSISRNWTSSAAAGVRSVGPDGARKETIFDIQQAQRRGDLRGCASRLAVMFNVARGQGVPAAPVGQQPPVSAQPASEPPAPVADTHSGGASPGNSAIEALSKLLGGPEKWTSPEGLSSALEMLLLTGVISLAPAILMMTTCFVRIVVVLGLLRQALGTQQLAAEPGDHVARAVHDAAGDVAGLEAGVYTTPSSRTRHREIIAGRGLGRRASSRCGGS